MDSSSPISTDPIITKEEETQVEAIQQAEQQEKQETIIQTSDQVMTESVHPTRQELVLYSAFNPPDSLIDVVQTKIDEVHKKHEVMVDQQPEINQDEAENVWLQPIQLKSVTLLPVKIWNISLVLPLLHKIS